MRIEVIRYDESRRADVVRLQKHLWSRKEAVNRRFLQWRYLENPLVDRPFVYLLLVDGEAVGMRGFLPWRWRLGAGPDTTILLGACDLVLDPRHRGKGLVRHLMAGALRDLSEQGHRLVLSFSASATTSLLALRQGWKQVVDYEWVAAESRQAARLRRGTASLRLLPLGNRVAAGLARWLRGPALGRFDAPGEGMELESSISVSDRPRLTEMIELMRGGDEHPPPLRVAPREDELEWRFRNPQRCYRFLFYEEGGRLLGFLVLSTGRARSSEVVILERRAVSDDIEARLFDALMRNGRVPRLTTWSAGLSHSATETLRRLGFAAFDASRGVRRYRPGFQVRPTADLRDPSSWRLSGRDVREAASWELRPLLSDAY